MGVVGKLNEEVRAAVGVVAAIGIVAAVVSFRADRDDEAVVKTVAAHIVSVSTGIDVDGDDGLFAVAIAVAVFLPAGGTFGGRFGVINHMMHRPARAVRPTRCRYGSTSRGR